VAGGPLGALLGRSLVLVTGKGGVGRSVVAGALAQVATAGGQRVLAVDAVGDGGLARALGADPRAAARGRPNRLADGTTVLGLATGAALEEYLRVQLRLPFSASIGPLGRVVDFVAAAAPAVREILTIGKIGWEVRQRHWDLVVVDAPASGHVIELLAAPQNLGEYVTHGPLVDQTAWLEALLADPAVTAAVVVTVPEELAVSECLELRARLEAETEVTVAATVANRVPERPEPGALDSVLDPAWTPVVALVEQRAEQARRQLARLRAATGEVVLVPEADSSALTTAEVGRWVRRHLQPVLVP
jgi:anion-transporting  ArsA/GET3 family ATPase